MLNRCIDVRENHLLWFLNRFACFSYFSGGGYCHTQEDCTSRSHGSLGSSTKWPESKSGGGLLSFDQEENVDFYNWSKVFIPVSYFPSGPVVNKGINANSAF